MTRAFLSLACFALLSACASGSQVPREPHPCDAGEHTLECQAERYKNMP